MKKRNKYIIIGGMILIIIIISIIFIIQKDGNNTEVSDLNVNKNEEKIEIYEILELKDIEESKLINVQKSEEKIFSKYGNVQLKEADKNISLRGKIGKMLFLRTDSQKANIFQIRYNEEAEYEYFDIEDIINIIEDSKNDYLELIGGENIEPESEIGDMFSVEIEPYCLTYKIENEEIKMEYEAEKNLAEELGEKFEDKYEPVYDEYDMNFYMDGDYLVCEFVKYI